MSDSENLTGGCQCGAVRYEMTAPPQCASICHCRMCQRASGQPFMAFTGGKVENICWTKRSPSFFKARTSPSAASARSAVRR